MKDGITCMDFEGYCERRARPATVKATGGAELLPEAGGRL